MSRALPYLEALEAHHTSSGEAHPWRTNSVVHKIDTGGAVNHYVIVSLDAHNTPIAVAVFGPTVGSDSYEIVRDASLWVSKMLQEDVSVQDILSMSGRHEDGRPRSILGSIADVLGEYV